MVHTYNEEINSYDEVGHDKQIDINSKYKVRFSHRERKSFYGRFA